MAGADIQIRSISAEDFDSILDGLTDLLNACVRDGASVNFIHPHSLSDSRAFWEETVRPALLAGHRALLVVWAGERLAGSVQLSEALQPNQAHRAEITKLLVDPAFRRRGIARILMKALEREAVARKRWLITLDTRTGDAAEPLYLSLGYQVAGVIPNYSRDPFKDTWDATTFLYKEFPRDGLS